MQHKKRTVRRWAQKSHAWLGIAAGLLFCVMGLSGAIIVFRPQIESLIGPQIPRESACAAFDANKATAAVNGFVKGAVVDRITFPTASDRPIILQLRKPGPFRVAYDPCSNRVLGLVNIGWLDWLVDLHHNLLAGKTGRRVVGVVGIALLFSSLSGLFVWMSSQRRHGITINSKASLRRIVYDFHRSAGLLAAIVLVVQSSTGIELAYPQLLRSALDKPEISNSAKKSSKSAEKRKHKTAHPASLAEIIRIAQEALPDGKMREIRGLGGDAKQIEVRFWRPGDVRESGNNSVYLNAAGTQAVSVALFSDATAGKRLSEIFTAIHYGEWGRLGSRILLAFTGIALALLFVSGFLIRWWPKRKMHKSASSVENDKLIAVYTHETSAR